MNPERWAEITRSFGVFQNETQAIVLPQESCRSFREDDVVKPNTVQQGGRLHNADYLKAEESAGERCVMRINQNGPWECQTQILQAKKVSEECGRTTADDVHGKIIANLCKIVKEKSEKIKIQEKVIESLTERLQGKSSKDIVVQTIDTFEESKPKIEKGEGSNVHSASLRKILLKVENLERRLNTVINFIQRQYPLPPPPHATTLASSDFYAGKKLDYNTESSVSHHQWNKPPTFIPRPTFTTLIRENHCRHRYNNNDNKSDKDTKSCVLTYPTPYSTNRKDGDIELRIQALEHLVVVLKGKLMKKIDMRKKLQTRQ